MKLNRGLWVGAVLLLALAGCDKDSDTVEGTGTFSPIITGISSNFEPAARGVPNQLTAQVTNVNNLGLRYHWRAAAGILTDSTSAVATWTPPDSIGTYDVTVSIEADDGGIHYFKTMTVHMAVDNEFVRWTRSETTKFDAAPGPGTTVLYAEYRNVSTGSSDIYRVGGALQPPSRVTTGFFSATSPSPRSDQVDFAFLAKLTSSQTVPFLYLLPFGGGDAADARLIARTNSQQSALGSPRFAPVGTRLAYVSDSTSPGYQKVWWRDGADLSTGPLCTVFTTDSLQMVFGPLFFNQYLRPSWGPDITGDGNPDSMLTVAADAFGNVGGLTKLWLPDTAKVWEDVPWLFSNQIEDPDWSPNGQHVVFAKKNAGSNDRDIWIINRAAADISQAVRVTFGLANDTQPRFGADGNTIFFVSNRVDRYGLNGIFGTERRGTNVWSVAQFDKP